MFFVYLPVQMRNVFLKICAGLLVVWYLTSVIGFAVHTCNASGRSFVATVLTGLSCDDIHPEHHCSHSHCCAGHQETHDCCESNDFQSLTKSSCCTNDFHVLLLTGSDNEGLQRHLDADWTLCQIFSDIACPDLDEVSFSVFSDNSPRIPDSGLIMPKNIHSFFGIWRI